MAVNDAGIKVTAVYGERASLVERGFVKHVGSKSNSKLELGGWALFHIIGIHHNHTMVEFVAGFWIIDNYHIKADHRRAWIFCMLSDLQLCSCSTSSLPKVHQR